MSFVSPVSSEQSLSVDELEEKKASTPSAADSLSDAAADPMAALIDIRLPPRAPVGDVTYSQLRCTEEDRSNISDLTRTLGKSSKWGILANSVKLIRIGFAINHVHPLKFLAVIFSQPELKECMKLIYDDYYFKRLNFMNGLKDSLNAQASLGKLERYLDDFAEEIGAKSADLLPFVTAKDWDGMVIFLMKS